MKGRKVKWWFIDKTFPMAQPPSVQEQQASKKRREDEVKECKARICGIPSTGDAAATVLDTAVLLAACQALLEGEQKRQQSIDARLTTVTGLSSIAASVVFGTLLTTAPRTRTLLPVLLLILLAYLVIQLVCAMLAAVRGLERRSYAALTCSQVLPADGESPKTYHQHQLEQVVDVLLDNREQNNEKMTQMAVAHCALKNFIAGLAVFAVLAGVHRILEQPNDELIARLKADRALRELVRGPQGSPGATGPRGPTGPTGPQGPAGEPGRVRTVKAPAHH
jgi:hypothetical protein